MAPAECPTSIARTRVTRPPTIESARPDDWALARRPAPVALLCASSILVSTSVSSPPSTFTWPRRHKWEMCTRGAPEAIVMMRGSAALAGRIAAPGAPSSHTCKRAGWDVEEGAILSGRS
eukprot:1818348-Prymnesium_polylepis.1